MQSLISGLIALVGIIYIWSTVVYYSGSYPLFLRPVRFFAACALVPIYATDLMLTLKFFDAFLVPAWTLLACDAYEKWRKDPWDACRVRQDRPTDVEPTIASKAQPVDIRIETSPDPEAFCGELRSRLEMRRT